jgi:Protein of unknown function (DUF2380)
LESGRNIGHVVPARRLIAASLLLGAGLALALGAAAGASAEERAPQTLAILPFEIDDTSGEVGSPHRHDAMLAALTRIVGERIEAAHLYKVVPPALVDKAVAAENSGTYLRDCNGCELSIARRAGADRVMIGWIFKMSSLVLTLHIAIKDVATGKQLYARAFDFRGDNETAWRRAADYMVGALAKSGETRSQSLGQ